VLRWVRSPRSWRREGGRESPPPVLAVFVPMLAMFVPMLATLIPMLSSVLVTPVLVTPVFVVPASARTSLANSSNT